jgi:hypothetical protein
MRRLEVSRCARYSVWIGVLVCLLSAAAVQAREPKVVIGPTARGSFTESEGQLVRDTLADALRMQGMRVTPLAAGAGDAVGARGCDLACGARLLATASAEMSAWAKLHRSSAAVGGAVTVTVTLLDASGHRFEGAAHVNGENLRDATTRAVLEARAYQLLGPGPWLRVAGTPQGAEVLIDGERVGSLPYRAAISSGRHELEVRDTGYVHFSQSLDVPDDDSRKLEVKVSLDPTPLTAAQSELAASASEPDQAQPSAADAALRASSSDSTWLAAPVAMGMVGIGLATLISVRLATGLSRCVDPDSSMRCVETRSVRWPATIGGYALSALLIGGAVTWVVLGMPERSEPTERLTAASAGRIQANVGLGQIGLSGSF